uniref:Nucleoside diphosphate kinase n=1 Tax=Homalodisca liturata TaxID=320908 RepID=A0A1B6JBJ8_9HEMI
MLSSVLSRSSLELTLAILKPHVVKASHALEAIHRIIENNGFVIVKSRTVRISQQQVEQFYEEHKNKFFYNRLITSMTSGDCEVYVLAKDNAIQDWRKLMGPTKVFQAIFSHPDSLRGMYGLTDTRNATHGSDSMESAAREISIFFPDFSVSQWLKENEESFQKEVIHSDQTSYIHSAGADKFQQSTSR